MKIFLALIVALGLATAAVMVPSSQNYSLDATGAGPGFHLCTDPNYTSSSPSGVVGYGGANDVSNDVWDNYNISQTLYACAENSFYVTASASSGGGEGGRVQSFPDANETLAAATPLSSLTSMYSNYRAYATPSCTGNDYEYANDPWWGGSTEWSGKSTEMMIWAYTCNQVPAGTELPGTITLSGESYTVWVGNDSAGNIITFEATKNYTSDHTDLLAFAKWAQSNGYLPNAYLWQMSDGAEICYTNGQITLGLQAFSLRINGAPAVTAPVEPAAARSFKAAFDARLQRSAA